MRGRPIQVGDTYGKLTVIKEVDEELRDNRKVWLCQCECGNYKKKNSKYVKMGKGCGYCGLYLDENEKPHNKYDLSGEYGIGYTSNGEEFYFDKEDYQKIKEYAWYLDKDGYVVTKDADTKKMIRMHRLVMNASEGMDIDHRHRKTNDNRKSQLREVTRSQNLMNRGIREDNTSSVTGVSWHKARSKWRAYITINGKTKHLGFFINKEEAIEARLKAELELYGTFSPNYEKLTQQQSDQQSQQNT